MGALPTYVWPRKGKGKGTSEHDQLEFIRYALDSLPTTLILDVVGRLMSKGISKGINMILDEIERRCSDDGEDGCSEPHCAACVMMGKGKGKGEEVEGKGKGKP